MRRRQQPRIPANPAARKQGDPLVADEPCSGFGQVARVGVLGNGDRERPLEELVERRDDERQSRLGDARLRGQRGGELGQPLVLEQLADEGVKNWTVHDERRNRPVPRPRSVVADDGVADEPRQFDAAPP